MDPSRLENQFSRIRIWEKGAKRAPHKPLLILYALGKLQRGEARQIPYRHVDRDLSELLVEYGPSRKSYHTEYPFWRLQNDGLWELHNAEGVQARRSNTDAKKSELLAHDVSGGFPQPVYDALRRDPPLLARIAREILDAHFPSSIHDDILEAVGLNLGDETYSTTRRKRDPAFRERILRVYEYRCATCDLDIRLGKNSIGVEAAHVMWHQAGGPDIEPNGLALCTLHHKLFDLGAFTLSDGLQVQVSEHVHGGHGVQDWLVRFHGQPIRPPMSPRYTPASDYLEWHRGQVFKQPARND